MIKEGANIIDIGGESTRPGSKTVLPNVEWKKELKILLKILKRNTLKYAYL